MSTTIIKRAQAVRDCEFVVGGGCTSGLDWPSWQPLSSVSLEFKIYNEEDMKISSLWYSIDPKTLLCLQYRPATVKSDVINTPAFCIIHTTVDGYDKKDPQQLDIT